MREKVLRRQSKNQIVVKRTISMKHVLYSVYFQVYLLNKHMRPHNNFNPILPWQRFNQDRTTFRCHIYTSPISTITNISTIDIHNCYLADGKSLKTSTHVFVLLYAYAYCMIARLYINTNRLISSFIATMSSLQLTLDTGYWKLISHTF